MWRNHGMNLVKRAVLARPSYRSVVQQYCSSGAAGNAKAVSYAEAKRLMRLVNVEALKEKLGKEDREIIPYDDLIKACQTTGVAKSSNEAAAFAGVLDDAGIVLLFRDKVYLNPHKVVDVVRRAMPAGLLLDEDVYKDKNELKKLQEQKEEIDMLAHKQVHRVLWSGLGILVIHLGLFFRLTFWEFSWDVMEPIAFFTTTAAAVVGYAYFLLTSSDPSYQDLLKRLFLSRQRKLMKTHNFDVVRFLELQTQFNQPLNSASIKRRLGFELHPDDLLHHHQH